MGENASQRHKATGYSNEEHHIIFKSRLFSDLVASVSNNHVTSVKPLSSLPTLLDPALQAYMPHSCNDIVCAY